MISDAHSNEEPDYKKNSENLDNGKIQDNSKDNEIDLIDFNENQMIEIARASWKSDSSAQRYLRGLLWAPDATCVLTAVNNEGMQIFEVPPECYEKDFQKCSRNPIELSPAVLVKESGTVYDYVWFPLMNSNDPVTCCWIASRQQEPIHMWDAFTGELRCSYRGYDQFDEVETAISLTFSSSGEQIYAGYKKSLKIFDTARPGRNYTLIKSKYAISALSIDENEQRIICGSWNTKITIFDTRTDTSVNSVPTKEHVGGITQLKIRDNKMFSGARKDNFIYEWDLRNLSCCISKYERKVETNQRIYFDLNNNILVSGGTDGILRKWDFLQNISTPTKYKVHNDCCNGVGISPLEDYQIFCTSSGQFKFSENNIPNIAGFEFQTGKLSEEMKSTTTIHYENSLSFWLSI